MKHCPFCAEEIQDDAVYCKHCKQWLNKKNVPTIKIGERKKGDSPKKSSYLKFILLGAATGLAIGISANTSLNDQIGHGFTGMFIYGAIGFLICALINKEYKKLWFVPLILLLGLFLTTLLFAPEIFQFPQSESGITVEKRTDTSVPIFATTVIQQKTPTSNILNRQIRESDGMVQVFVPAGEFEMGSDSGNEDETPLHRIFLNDYWIDQTEVTNLMYQQCVATGHCIPPSSFGSNIRTSYYGNAIYNNYPVIMVNWDQANDYCTWVGGRLPTEAEWEKAAKGLTDRLYPWGNESPTNTYLNLNSTQDTTAAGSFPAGSSPYGALDMAGNVVEWVGDWYGESYYSISPADNPSGPTLGQYRVLRGGAWNDDGKLFFRTTKRGGADPTAMYTNFGFRCVVSINLTNENLTSTQSTKMPTILTENWRIPIPPEFDYQEIIYDTDLNGVFEWRFKEFFDNYTKAIEVPFRWEYYRLHANFKNISDYYIPLMKNDGFQVTQNYYDNETSRGNITFLSVNRIVYVQFIKQENSNMPSNGVIIVYKRICTPGEPDSWPCQLD